MLDNKNCRAQSNLQNVSICVYNVGNVVSESKLNKLT